MSKFNLDFPAQVEAWSTPPTGGMNTPSVGVLSAGSIQLLEWVTQAYKLQYQQPSNWNGLYRKLMGLDDTTNKTVLDFGCGLGMDALAYSMTGNMVALADISMANLLAAGRILQLTRHSPIEILKVQDRAPFLVSNYSFDIFHSAGVLHHTPAIREILQSSLELMWPFTSEYRLMLYSDKAWQIATQTELPPIDQPVHTHPDFERYVRFMDAVGSYADWYSKEKLEMVVGDFLEILSFDYIREDGAYVVVRLKQR